jgi:hypothetical protein
MQRLWPCASRGRRNSPASWCSRRACLEERTTADGLRCKTRVALWASLTRDQRAAANVMDCAAGSGATTDAAAAAAMNAPPQSMAMTFTHTTRCETEKPEEERRCRRGFCARFWWQSPTCEQTGPVPYILPEPAV